MTDKPKLNFNRKEYEFATFDTFTIDEAILLYNYSGLTLDQLDQTSGFNPGLIKTLIHVSVARAEPQLSERELGKLVGKLRVADLEKVFETVSVEADEEDRRPPDSPTPSGETNSLSGVRNDNGSPTSSGESSPTGSAESPDPSSLAASSGGPGSVIGSPV